MNNANIDIFVISTFNSCNQSVPGVDKVSGVH